MHPSRQPQQRADEKQVLLANRTHSRSSPHDGDRKGVSTRASVSRADPPSRQPDRSRPWRLDRDKQKISSPQQRQQKPPEKVRGFWNWRPFRTAPSPPPPPPPALSPIRLRFHVLFSLHVHAIHGLPASMNGLRLIVHWKRKEEGIQTMPTRVLDGLVEFNEILRQRCTIFGVRNSHPIIKYDAKLFTLSAVTLDVNGLQLGQHYVDLSCLLPEEDIDHPDAHHGSGWNTTFQLSGMAKGASLSVTFNYDLLHHETLVGNDYDGDDHDDTLLHVNENPVSTTQCSSLDSATTMNLSDSRHGLPPDSTTAWNLSGPVHNPGHDTYDLSLPSPLEDSTPDECTLSVVHQHDDTVNEIRCSAAQEVLIEHLPGAQSEFIKRPEVSYLVEESLQIMNDGNNSKYKIETDFEDEIELVAGEFLDMLDIGFGSSNPESEGEPDSPRERLLKQCESLLAAGNLEDTAVEGLERDEFDRNFDAEDDDQIVSIMEAAEMELQKAVQTAQSKSRAKALEDEETQALMREWGLSEKTFQNSSPRSVTSSLQKSHLSRAPLGNGLGPVLKFKDGGSLRSMNPAHFPKANINGGTLVMQTSQPVVVPSTMGSTAVDILRHLASFGADALGKQALTAMPLEDITGMFTDGGATQQDERDHNCHLEHRSKASSFMGSQCEMVLEKCGIKPDFTNNRLKEKTAGGYDDYVSLEDLAPLAMDNIEALAIDGLKVQANMADEDAPSYLDAAAWGILGDQVKDNISLSDSVAGLHFKSLESMDALSAEAKQIGPLTMAITLEEWSKLDAGALDDSERTNERSLAILAAHNAHYQNCEITNREDSKRGHARKGGIMGNTLMIAMLVQLRDPLRNFESVGVPMMALIQAERIMVPPKPRIGRRVSVKGNNEVDDEEEAKSQVMQKDDIPQFKLTGVHMSGLKSIEEDEMKLGRGFEIQKNGWGAEKQLQSGSRWLLAQGMGKSSSKHSLLKSKASPAAQTKVKPGETLWSISARVNGSGQKWRDLAALNPHIRNPDVIFTNDKIRTR